MAALVADSRLRDATVARIRREFNGRGADLLHCTGYRQLAHRQTLWGRRTGVVFEGFSSARAATRAVCQPARGRHPSCVIETAVGCGTLSARLPARVRINGHGR